MNLNQQAIHDFITRQLDLLRYEKTVRAEIFSLLDTMQTSVAEKLGNPNAQAVIDGVEKILNDGYALVLKALDVLPVLDAEFLWLYGWLGGLATAYKLRDKIVPFTKKAVNKIAQSFTLGGLTLPESVCKQRDDLLLKLKSLVRSADDKLGFGDLTDTFNRAKQYAQTLSKTWINAVQNTAHEAFGRVNPLVKAYRHVSVLDGDTSAVCTLRNGLLWNKKHEPIGHKEVFKRPPLHPNCRSKLVYVFNLKDEFQGISGDDWVKSRSLKELQEQFGVGIGQMLFDGKIKLRDAVDGLKPLTLTELKGKLTKQKYGTTLSRSVFELPDVQIFLRELPKHLPRIQEYAKKYDLTETDYTALFLYSRLGKSMNMAIYQADKIPKQQILAWQELNQVANEALDKLPDYVGIVTRRIKPYPNFAQQHQIGTLVTYDNLTSSSLDGSVFKGLPDYKITLTIQSKHGKLIEQISALPQQHEVLFKMGTQFKVLDYQEKGDEIWVNLMEI